MSKAVLLKKCVPKVTTTEQKKAFDEIKKEKEKNPLRLSNVKLKRILPSLTKHSLILETKRKKKK